MKDSDIKDIRSIDVSGLKDWVSSSGQPEYRVQQILSWLYKKRVNSLDEMTNLPQSLRESLKNSFSLDVPKLVRVQGSKDTTAKFLWEFGGGDMVESVLIPANLGDGGDQSNRKTHCVSSQVGCAYGCKFCASGLDGLKRNLNVHEIVGQIIAVENWHAEQTGDFGPIINNLVFMGMGEPLANYKNLIPALAILNAEWGLNIGARRITISTSGLAPLIERLAEEPQQYRLAISLHGATDVVRDKIMPVNKKFPLEILKEACLKYQKKKGKMITLEYILIRDINDSLDQVPYLAQLAKRLSAKVNLIPYNTVDGLDWERPLLETQRKFAAKLSSLGVTATLRREKGHDIDAACGQLRLKTQKTLN